MGTMTAIVYSLSLPARIRSKRILLTGVVPDPVLQNWITVVPMNFRVPGRKDRPLADIISASVLGMRKAGSCVPRAPHFSATWQGPVSRSWNWAGFGKFRVQGSVTAAWQGLTSVLT